MEIPPTKPDSESEELHAVYANDAMFADRLITCLREQLSAIFEQNDITLGVPLETRVKSWSSVQDKINRNKEENYTINDIEDMAGIRLILLFSRDVDKLDSIIKSTLVVQKSENVIDRLSESEFGYQSNHYIATIPESWTKIPSNVGLAGKKVEIQVRTMAQHIWAAASHKLQYKHETSVPPPIRRAIHRVSAILETVDLEFSRVLEQREKYISEMEGLKSKNEILNTDLIDIILRDIYPVKNFYGSDQEDYSDLLREIRSYDITTYGELEEILKKYLSHAMKKEESAVDSTDIDDVEPGDEGRYHLGVYFTPVGLARISLSEYFRNEKQ